MNAASDVEFWRTAFDRWFAGLKIEHKRAQLPARGSLAAALLILERLKERFNLDLDQFLAPGGSQITGLTPAAIQKILLRYGEQRRFLGEGGRTNRGNPRTVQSLLIVLDENRLGPLALDERNEVLSLWQRFLVEKIQIFLDMRRMVFPFNPAISVWETLTILLRDANKDNKAAAVAQHLVGAYLEMALPSLSVANHSHSAADASTGRNGDFQFGEVVFHVTINPGFAVLDKCSANLKSSLRAVLLVPTEKLFAARESAISQHLTGLAVESIESFVAWGLEVRAKFQRQEVRAVFDELIAVYNRRVAEVESDRSILFEEIPVPH